MKKIHKSHFPLQFFSFSIHTIVKRFRESRDITVHVGQGRKPQLKVFDLWALRWRCIRNRHAAVLNIATWAQEYFRKPLSFTTVCCFIKKCILNICYSRRKLCCDAARFSGPELIPDSQKDSENVCCTQMSPQFWLVSRKNGPKVPMTKDHPDFYYRQQQKQTSVGVQQSKRHGWLKYVTLDHKTSLKSLGYVCSNNQKSIVWVKIIDFSFMPKIIRILSKDHVPWRYFVHFLP